MLAHGLSYPPHGPQDYAALAALIEPLLPTTPFVLLGESFAGPLAMQVAARALPALRGLVLTTTFAAHPVPLPASAAHLLRLRWPMPPTAALAPMLLGRWSSRALRIDLREALATVPAVVLRERVAATLQVDLRGQLAAIGVPVLCLQALQDRLLWPASVAALRRGLPQAQWQAMEGPHLLLQARPEACAQAVATWMADHFP